MTASNAHGRILLYCLTNIKSKGIFYGESSHKLCVCNLIDSQSFVIYGTLFLKASTWLSAFSPQEWALHEERLYMVTASLRLLSVQFSSGAQSCPTLCDPMNHSKPGLPVHHQLPEFTQTHVHRVRDAIQPSPAPNPSQHRRLFQWVNSSHEVAEVLEFQL